MGRLDAGREAWVRVTVRDPLQETRALALPGSGPAAAFSWSPVTLDGQRVFSREAWPWVGAVVPHQPSPG